MIRPLALGFATLLLTGCLSESAIVPEKDRVAIGTWGGDNAGVVVDDTVAHVHVGCTYGNFFGRITLDNVGAFSAKGEYLLRAYPIAIGPPLPATIAGSVRSNKLTFTVTVNDTVMHTSVVLGPATVTYGQDPHMQVCPICRKPRAITQLR